MDDLSIKPMLILDLNFELLHSQVVYTPGSRDKRGGSVIFFDTNKRSWENADLNSEELAKLLIYYYKIPKYVLYPGFINLTFVNSLLVLKEVKLNFTLVEIYPMIVFVGV